MALRVDARDVLDADAVTSRAFAGRIVGVFRRTGPNSWDDYVLAEKAGGPIDVLAETPVQVESEGAVVRLRRAGEVVQVEWVPDAAEAAAPDRRKRFLESYIRHDDPTPEGNLGLWLHGELHRKPEASD